MACRFDHTAYPHLIDAIIAAADVPALLKLRATNRSFCARADDLLFGHVRLDVGGEATTLCEASSGHRLPFKPDLVRAADVGSRGPHDVVAPLARLDTLRRSGDAMYAPSAPRRITTLIDFIDLHPPTLTGATPTPTTADEDDDDGVYGDVLGRRFALDRHSADRWTVAYPFSVDSYILHIRLDTASTMPRLWRYFFDGMASLSSGASLTRLVLVLHPPELPTPASISMTLALSLLASQQAVISMSSGSVTFVGVDVLAKAGGTGAEVSEWLRQVRVFGSVWAPHLETRCISMQDWRAELGARATLEGEWVGGECA
ncbi:uncharacterized protein LOC62_04G005259 [Vanrija pseudolonga]|uniref:Uncharacterized protein n=1 Tax=Vanrija pseudolonga TaxID=143232 RepID=A0AAF0Y7P7_9TREE|nr:hypothetical protein LOC62_04G005259 [Vanrija pseudolonga]